MAVIDESRPVLATGRSNVWAFIGAALVALHGIAHLVGVGQAFDAFADDENLLYFFDGVAIGHSGALALVATVWTLAALGFAAGAVLIVRRAPSARTWLTTTTVLSFVLCLAALPDAVIGAAVDAALLVYLTGRSLPEWSWEW